MEHHFDLGPVEFDLLIRQANRFPLFNIDVHHVVSQVLVGFSVLPLQSGRLPCLSQKTNERRLVAPGPEALLAFKIALHCDCGFHG